MGTKFRESDFTLRKGDGFVFYMYKGSAINHSPFSSWINPARVSSKRNEDE